MTRQLTARSGQRTLQLVMRINERLQREKFTMYSHLASFVCQMPMQHIWFIMECTMIPKINDLFANNTDKGVVIKVSD